MSKQRIESMRKVSFSKDVEIKGVKHKKGSSLAATEAIAQVYKDKGGDAVSVSKFNYDALIKEAKAQLAKNKKIEKESLNRD